MFTNIHTYIWISAAGLATFAVLKVVSVYFVHRFSSVSLVANFHSWRQAFDAAIEICFFFLQRKQKQKLPSTSAWTQTQTSTSTSPANASLQVCVCDGSLCARIFSVCEYDSGSASSDQSSQYTNGVQTVWTCLLLAGDVASSSSSNLIVSAERCKYWSAASIGVDEYLYLCVCVYILLLIKPQCVIKQQTKMQKITTANTNNAESDSENNRNLLI